MSLDRAALHKDFVLWFSRPGGIYAADQAEEKMALIYHTYAQQAEDVSGEKATNLNVKNFRDVLDFQRSRTAEQFCQQMDRAFVAYWTGVIFANGIVPPPSPPCPNVGGTGIFWIEFSSSVTSVTLNVLYGLLLPVVLYKKGSAQVQALRFASALDEATKRAVTVYITGLDTSLPFPLPITNTCTVF